MNIYLCPNHISSSRKKGKENSPLKMAARNTNLWEARINMMDRSCKQNRLVNLECSSSPEKRCSFVFNSERVETLATDNETLRDQMRQTEKDTLDVVSFLKKQDLEKDTEVKYLLDFRKEYFRFSIARTIARRSENIAD